MKDVNPAYILRDENETVTEVNNGITLIQNKKGLTFGTDALMLAAFIKKTPSLSAVEIGSGSGIISLLLGIRGKLGKITAVEVQEYYASLTRRNAELNGLDDKITAVCSDIRDYRGEAKVVFANPPYMKTGCGKDNTDDKKYIARHEVFGTVEEICSSAYRILLYGGSFYCVYRPDRLPELITAMTKAGLEPKRIAFVHQDTLHEPCLVLIESKKGGKPSCRVSRPLFLCEDGTNIPTKDAAYIYENGEWFE